MECGLIKSMCIKIVLFIVFNVTVAIFLDSRIMGVEIEYRKKQNPYFSVSTFYYMYVFVRKSTNSK